MLIKAGGRKPLEISNLLLDFNGTLAQNGLIGGDAKKLVDIIAQDMKVYVATADTRGNAAKECSGLPVELLELPSGMPEDEAKLQLLEKIGADTTIAFGNGRNDALILARAALGICVVGREGAHKMSIASAEVVVNSIEDALKLITEPVKLIATLRN